MGACKTWPMAHGPWPVPLVPDNAGNVGQVSGQETMSPSGMVAPSLGRRAPGARGARPGAQDLCNLLAEAEPCAGMGAAAPEGLPRADTTTTIGRPHGGRGFCKLARLLRHGHGAAKAGRLAQRRPLVCIIRQVARARRRKTPGRGERSSRAPGLALKAALPDERRSGVLQGARPEASVEDERGLASAAAAVSRRGPVEGGLSRRLATKDRPPGLSPSSLFPLPSLSSRDAGRASASSVGWAEKPRDLQR